MLRRAAQQLTAAGLRAARTPAFGEACTQQQTRGMAGGGHDIWYKTYNNKPVPPQYQGPDYITYAGVTIKKEFHAFDYYLSQAFGAAATFTMLYHFYLNAEEHWHGDIYFFEKDVQLHGWDDGHGHGHEGEASHH